MEFKISRATPKQPGSINTQIGSVEFTNWFKGSKVVDSTGRPTPVFHGTSEDFLEFNTEEIYVTEDRTVAEDFGDRVMKLAACIKNPLTYEYEEGPGMTREEAIAKGYDGWQILNYDTGDEIFRPEGSVWVAFSKEQLKAFPR